MSSTKEAAKKSWWDKLNMGKKVGSSSEGAKGFGAVIAGKKRKQCKSCGGKGCSKCK